MTDPIKAKIQELVPEVMELKFGCEIGTHAGGIKTCFVAGRQLSDWRCYAENLDGTVSFLGLKSLGDNYEILGSPLTLAVVLRAIGKTEKGHLYARADGKTAVFFRWNSFAPDKCHAVAPTYIEWNLEHDNYDQQTEECKKFIGSLLGV